MSEKEQKLPRDVFIDEIYEAARKDPRINFITADLGAKALDRFRVDCKDQFLHAGICEQNMMDLAAGLAQNGKLVYAYAMAPFVTMRCFEQIKVAIASMQLPMTIIGNGVGFSYNDAGPTHYATEDISCMRALAGVEILTAADTVSARATARRTHQKPGFYYVRLDRAFLPDVYEPGDHRFEKDGLVEIDSGKDLCIIASGYTVQLARKIRETLAREGHTVAVVDAYRIKPIDPGVLESLLKPYSKIVTYEEHFISGGMGGAIVEAMADAGITRRVLRIAMKDHYYCENGGRSYLHKLAGIDLDSALSRVRDFIRS